MAGQVEGGTQVDGGREEVAADVDLVLAGADDVGGEDAAVRVAKVGQADAAADGLAPGAGGHLADGGPVAEYEFAAPDHDGGIGHHERDQAAARAGRAGLLERLAAQEADAGLELAGEQQPGLGRVVVRGQLAAEGPVGLLQPQRLDRVVAGVGQVQVGALVHQVLVGAHGELGRDVQFPAELAHVGDPGRADRGVAEVDLAARAEREGLVAEITAGEPGQQVTRSRAHDPVYGVLRGDVHQRGVQVCGHPPRDVVLVAFGGCRAADQQERISREPGDGDVGLVGAVSVQHPGVDGPARGDRDVGGAQPLQHLFGVPAGHQVLGEAGLVEQGDGGAGGALLGAGPGLPVLLAPAVLDVRALAGRREEVRPLPAHLAAEARVGLLEQVVRRGSAERPGGVQLAVRPRHGVVQAEDLADPVVQPLVVPVEGGEAADVDRGQVQVRLSRRDPLGQRPPGTARGRDADRVEAGGDEEVPQLRRLAEDELVVRGEALRAVVEHLDPGLGEHRDALYGTVHEDREVVPVLVEQLELERVGQRVGGDPGLGVGFEAADHQPADLLLDVGVAVRVAQDREVPVHTVDLLGDHVEVFGRVQRHGHPGQRADLLGPLAGTVDHHLGLDVAAVGADASYGAFYRAFYRAVGGQDAGDAGALAHRNAHVAGAPGQRGGQVGRVGPAVAGQPDRPGQVVHGHDRVELAGPLRADQLAFQLVGLGGGGGPPKLCHAVGGTGNGDAAAAPEAGAQAGLRLQPGVQLGGVLDQAGAVLRGAQLADQAGRVPGGAAGQLPLLEQEHVGPAQLGEVVADAGADHAATDDHDPGAGGNFSHLAGRPRAGL